MTGPHRKLLLGAASVAHPRTKPAGAALVHDDMVCLAAPVGVEARGHWVRPQRVVVTLGSV